MSLPSPSPIPPAPPAARVRLTTLFVLRDAKRRWPFALRAAACMATPVAVGWALGDVAAGLMATIGAFTSLYGSGRPYLVRAVQLALTAVAFALAVALGIAAASVPWLGVLTVAVIAMLATLLSNALRIGPPGAYMFTLACAAGTAMGAEHLSAVHTGLLVLSGGALAWVLHMAGALVRPRGPEKSAVAAAGEAVARYIEAADGPARDTARHWAAVAMHESWVALVNDQPASPHPESTLARLRGVNRELHRLFAENMAATARHRPLGPAAAAFARDLAHQAGDPHRGVPVTSDALPLGRPGRLEVLRRAVGRGSPLRVVVARVGVAALVAGFIAGALGVERAYWAIAAAVLILHQGLDWVRTLQRGLERLVGTWAGLALAALLLSAHPSGLGLVVTVAVLQFAIEMLVVRNYALAVIVITPVALTIASGGRPVADLGGFVLARGVDTTLGCAVALGVYALTPQRFTAPRLPQLLVAVLGSVRATLDHLAAGDVTSAAVRTARRDLQTRAIALTQAYDAETGTSARRVARAERLWPTVVAVQRLAYRTLSECWAMEHEDAAAARERAEALFGDDGRRRLDAALQDLAGSLTADAEPGPLGELPTFLAPELRALHDSLSQG
jgi:uncharacterized membrane protein YccC